MPDAVTSSSPPKSPTGATPTTSDAPDATVSIPTTEPLSSASDKPTTSIPTTKDDSPTVEDVKETVDEISADDIIDMETFEQLLDLDEDSYDFSRGMAWDYFSQAKTTFTQMKEALTVDKLPELSSLGHFLKGSSAAIGIKKVQATCEKIQHYGHLRDAEAGKDLKADDALNKIKASIAQVEVENAVAEAWLRKYFADHGVEDTDA